jgi:hypothetical protein
VRQHAEGPPVAVHSLREVFIRTLSVSLLAVAVIAAGIILTRDSETGNGTTPPAGENLPTRAELDTIRAAGL